MPSIKYHNLTIDNTYYTQLEDKIKLHVYLQDTILKLQLSFKRENTGFKKGEGY